MAYQRKYTKEQLVALAREKGLYLPEDASPDTTSTERMPQMKTSRSAQEWRDSWRELKPYLSWFQRNCKSIIAAETPEQIEAFISRCHRHSHTFTDDEFQGLRDGSIREAVKEWRETSIRMAKEQTQRERLARMAALADTSTKTTS